MRPIAVIVALATLPALAAEPEYPHWYGQESIEQYAKRAGLEPAKTIDLGDGVTMQFVLIPAGTFTMGTPEPEPVDEQRYGTHIRIGVAAFVLGVCALLVLLSTVLSRAIREQRPLQVSLTRMLVLAFVAGIALLGGMHWYHWARGFAEAQDEYYTALARFRSSSSAENLAAERTLTQPYYMGKYEVTQEQYLQVMGSNPSHFKGSDLPVEQVWWDQAQTFCWKVSSMPGIAIRLPTQAEWERACRAGTRTTYYTGDSEADLDRAGWHKKNSNGTTHPVGQMIPNQWGICDMHGNVVEWCVDWCASGKAANLEDAQGRTEGPFRVLRGGSWDDPSHDCRSSARGRGFREDIALRIVGFRVVLSLPEAP